MKRNELEKSLEPKYVQESISPLKEKRKELMLERLKSYGTGNFILYWLFVIGAGIAGFMDFNITKTIDVIFIYVYCFTVVFWGIFFCFYYLGPAFRTRKIKKLIEQNKIDELKEDACKTYLFTKSKKNLAIAALIEIKEISSLEINSFLNTYHADDGLIYFSYMTRTRTDSIARYLKTVSILWDIDRQYSLFDILLAIYFFGVGMLSFELVDVFFIALWTFLGFIGIILLIVLGGIIVNLFVFRRISSLAKKNEMTKIRLIADEAWPTGWKALYAIAALKDIVEEETFDQ